MVQEDRRHRSNEHHRGSREELAGEVRQRFPELPVIIASGYGKSESRTSNLRFIGKPYSAIDLQQALDDIARTTPPT